MSNASLLPPNSTQLERITAETNASIGSLEVPIASLWTPHDCPAHVLPWLAWAYSVDEWDTSWTEQQKRDAIDAAVFIHRHKGTVAAVKRAVDSIFDEAEVQEWFDYDGEPFHFRVVSQGAFTSDRDYRRLIRQIESAKNARSWLEAIVIRSDITLSVYLGGYTHTGATIHLRNRIDPQVGTGQTWAASALHRATTTEVRPAGVAITLPDLPLYAGSGHLIATTTTIQPRT